MWICAERQNEVNKAAYAARPKVTRVEATPTASVPNWALRIVDGDARPGDYDDLNGG